MKDCGADPGRIEKNILAKTVRSIYTKTQNRILDEAMHRINETVILPLDFRSKVELSLETGMIWKT